MVGLQNRVLFVWEEWLVSEKVAAECGVGIEWCTNRREEYA